MVKNIKRCGIDEIRRDEMMRFAKNRCKYRFGCLPFYIPLSDRVPGSGSSDKTERTLQSMLPMPRLIQHDYCDQT